MAALLLMGVAGMAGTAQAGLPNSGRLLHDRCPKTGGGCEVTVLVTGQGTDQCGVVSKHVVIVDNTVSQIVWKLQAGASATLSDYAFGSAQGVFSDGVKVDANDDGSADDSNSSAGATVFSVDGTGTTATQLALNVSVAGRKLRKAYLYTIQVQRKDGSTTKPCNPLDPMIITRGD